MAILSSSITILSFLLQSFSWNTDPGSAEEESFKCGHLEYPQYTRPADYQGEKVPDVLLSGNHKKIAAWREEAARDMTMKYRPDLL
ncbi:MAG: hypothetical protein II123_07500 [Lachnospiraceae bacterium]|nr:hypothetical protein [Lachnospiraceae bacterium]